MKTKQELAVIEYFESFDDIKESMELSPNEAIGRVLRFFSARRELHIPTKLYKFRVCNNINFHTLEQNCIWMPKADTFCDVSDCSMSVNFDFRETLKNHAKTRCGYRVCLDMLCNCTEKVDFGLSLTDFLMIKSRVDKIADAITIDNHRQKLSGILPTEKEDRYFECIEYIYSMYLNCISKQKSKRQVVDETRKHTYVYSMTSMLNNSLLWENYAKHYSGFCIEYNISEECFFYDEKMLHLYPVIYKRKIPFLDAKRFDILKTACFDTKEINKDSLKQFKETYGVSLYMQLLYKHVDYKYEYEWRIIGNDLKDSLQPFPYASRIIAGKDIKPRNLACLRKIAHRLKVPIARQIFDETQNNFIYVDE